MWYSNSETPSGTMTPPVFRNCRPQMTLDWYAPESTAIGDATPYARQLSKTWGAIAAANAATPTARASLGTSRRQKA